MTDPTAQRALDAEIQALDEIRARILRQHRLRRLDALVAQQAGYSDVHFDEIGGEWLGTLQGRLESIPEYSTDQREIMQLIKAWVRSTGPGGFLLLECDKIAEGLRWHVRMSGPACPSHPSISPNLAVCFAVLEAAGVEIPADLLALLDHPTTTEEA